jgi:hypothetical protein
LKFDIIASIEGGEYYASIEFVNADDDEDPGSTSVRYVLRGFDKDWVFVSSSLINERIDKIKRFALNQFSSKIAQITFPILFLIVFVIPIAIVSYNRNKEMQRLSPVKELTQMYSQNKINNPIDAIIFLEQKKEQNDLNKNDPISQLKPIVYGFISFGLLFLLYLFFVKYYLVYNFCLGDYLTLFQKRESGRKFWLVVIGVGIIVSFVGGVLANKIPIW